MPNQFISPEGDLEEYFVDEYWLIDQWIGDTLWVWGRNYYGTLGINNTINRCTPVTTFSGGVNWKQVSGGRDHSAAIKTDGTLWVWGRNYYGQLGINNTAGRTTPVTVFGTGTNWKQVDCGYAHTSAIKTDGTLWTWGLNYGRLGNNTGLARTTPVTTFAGGTNWKQVACGTDYTAAIKTDGTLWTWGGNGYGQLGINIAPDQCTPVTTFAGGTNWKQVSCGNGQTAAIKTDGTLWIWGNNTQGQLGVNNTANRNTPVTTFAGGTNWKQVACGGNYTAAIKTDGTLWLWGNNEFGQLGINLSGLANGRTTPVTTFSGGNNWKQVSIGEVSSTTKAIKTDGTLWTWGINTNGQLGNNNDLNNSITPITTFAGGTNWKQVSNGYTHTLAVTSGTDPTFFIA